MKGAALSAVEFPDALLTGKGSQAVHDAVVAHQAALRAGTASTLRKGEVAGSGKKPWKQKGTGRARAGYKQSPVWRGGAVAFGPHPRSYAKKMSRKVARLAFRRAFSDLVLENRVRVLDQLEMAEPKVKAATALLKALGIKGGVLILVDKLAPNLICAVRNLPSVEATTVESVSTYQLLQYPEVIITRAALDGLRGRLEGDTGSQS
jgi:large subunit ribosomal protein L4